jgi:PAS domain S-box-containing protein
MPLTFFAGPRLLGFFRALLATVVVAPLSLFALDVWHSRQKALEQAAENTREIVSMLHEHALKVMSTHDLILRQADHWMAGRDWDAILQDEQFRRSLASVATQQDEVLAIWLTDGSGHIRMGTSPFMSPLYIGDRDFFAAQREEGVGTYIGAPYVSRTRGERRFAASRRRTTATGEFDGIIHVTVQPEYFTKFWRGVVERLDLDATVGLTRADGLMFARYPAVADDLVRLPQSSPLRQAIARADEGTGTWRSPIDGSTRIISYKKLSGYPVYVSFSVGQAAVLARWWKHVAWHAGFVLPAVATLAFLALIALRRARAQIDAEADARATEARLRRILESTTESVYVLDRDWRFIFLNARAETALSRGRNLLGMSFWEAFPDAVVGDSFWNACHTAMLDRVPASVETSYLGFGAWFEVHAHPFDTDSLVVFFRDITERKRSEEALRRTEEHSARAQRAAAIGTWEWNAVSDTITWSVETFRLFGVSPETFTPSPESILPLISRPGRAAIQRIRSMVVQGIVPSPAEIAQDHHVRLPDGTVRLLHREGAAVLDGKGRPIGLVGTVQDVTAARRAEQRLRESEERYRLAARAAGCAIWDWDPVADRIEWVGATEELFGVPADALDPTYDCWNQRLHPEDRERVTQRLKSLFAQGGEFWVEEYRLRRADGSYAFVHVRAYTIYGSGGEPVRMIGAMMDITPRREMEKELRRNALHLARAQQVASLGSFEYDPRTGEQRWSDEMYRIVGVQPETFTPSVESMRAIAHPDDVDRVRSLADLIKPPRPSRGELGADFRIVRPDGAVRILHRECDLIFDAFGEIICIVGTVQDVTEARLAERQRQELEMQLVQAQKMEALGTLAGGIAHDLNNALVPVLALSKLAASAMPPDTPEREDLMLVHQGACRARDLVQQILAFSRGEEPIKERVDLHEFILEQMPMLRAGIPSTVHLDVNLDPVPAICGDPSQLFQVLLNIMTNASQAIGSDHGTIAVRLGFDGEAVQLTIADNGPGMDQATMRRIFDPFFTTKAPGEGSGLGLAVVHGIVGSHGGRIEVDSAPGEGSVFTVHLPIARPPASEAMIVAERQRELA